MATSYGMDGRGSIPDKGKKFYVLHSVQSGSGAHPFSIEMCTRGALSPGIKRTGRDADHSPPSGAELKNGGAVPFLFHTSS
jgi:hypothetical protein